MTIRVLMTEVLDDDRGIASNHPVKDFQLDSDRMRVLFGSDIHHFGIAEVC